MADVSRVAEARGPARQAARGSASHSGPRHLRRRHRPRRHAAPGVQAQRRRARPYPLHRYAVPRRRWKASKRSSPARRSPSSWRRCRSARRSRRPTIVRSPWTRSATAASRSPSSWRAIATLRGTPPTPSSSTYDTLPAVVDLELAMTGTADGHPSRLSEQPGGGAGAERHRRERVRRRRRLGDRRGVRQGRGRHLAADGEPAPRAVGDGAERRGGALRAGQRAR